MPTIQDEEDYTTFVWEDSDEMDQEKSCLISNDGDFLPLPQDLDVAKYLYIAFIWVPGSKRQKGIAKILITKFCEDNSDSNIYIELCKSEKKNNPLNGLLLENFLKSQGFEVNYRLPHRIGMLLKRE